MIDLIYWRLPSGVNLMSILGPPTLVAEAISRDHDKTMPNRTVLRQHIPYGVTGWREKVSEPWRSLDELPPNLFLMRS